MDEGPNGIRLGSVRYPCDAVRRQQRCEQVPDFCISFLPPLEGVLIAHSHARFLYPLGSIDGDSAFAEVPVRFTGIVWRPEIGMKLQGTITLCSPSHVSLLLYDTFNAAISAPHIPASMWEFVYYSDVGEVQRVDAKDRSVGFWRNKESGERLGGKNHTLQFSVISMTVANQMLSLHGSLLQDPFSVPPPRPGTLSFDQAMGTMEPMDEETSEEVPMPRRVRWEDSDEEDEQKDDQQQDNNLVEGVVENETDPEHGNNQMNGENNQRSMENEVSQEQEPLATGSLEGDESTSKIKKKDRKKEKEKETISAKEMKEEKKKDKKAKKKDQSEHGAKDASPEPKKTKGSKEKSRKHKHHDAEKESEPASSKRSRRDA